MIYGGIQNFVNGLHHLSKVYNASKLNSFIVLQGLQLLQNYECPTHNAPPPSFTLFNLKM